MKKKCLSVTLFALALFMIAFIKQDAAAANVYETKTEGTITWTMYDDGTLDITGTGELDGNLGYKNYRSTAIKKVNIGGTITSIGYGAFKGCIKLTSITIPDSVTAICEYAFSGCSSLTSITIPDSVTSICEHAFSGCSSLTSITIPDSVASIGHYAFSGCSSLTSIEIPDSVTSIEGEAFSGCNSLTNITIPDSVTSIGDYAFYECSSLTSITIPDSVTSIGDYAFYECRNLINVTISDQFSDSELVSSFRGTPWYITWYISKIGTLKGSIGDVFYELDSAGNLSLKGSGKLFISDDNNIRNYKIIVKNIIISNDSNFEIGNRYLTDYFENTEKIINNSALQIRLEYGDDFSWCNINDTTEPIFSISNGTAIKVNQKLAKHYKIVFNGNGATSGSMNEIIAEAGKSLRLPKNCFAKEHYIFDEWKYTLSYSGSYTEYRDDEGSLSIDISTVISNPVVTLYAQWREAEKYTVYFISYDGSGCSGSMPSVLLYEGDSYILPENGLTAPEGKEFDSWRIGSSYYKTGDVITIHGDTDIYAVWKDKNTDDLIINVDTNAKENIDSSLKTSKVLKLSAGKKAITIKWKKQAKQTNGYEIQFSTDKKFKKDVKALNIKKIKTVTKTIKKLKSGKKYYVRIRTYKNVNGKKVYSKWSKTKSVKTK